MYDLVVETYEAGRREPVVTHTFHGDTPEQAKAFFRAHLKYDAFLKSCQTGHFKKIRCFNRVVGIFER